MSVLSPVIKFHKDRIKLLNDLCQAAKAEGLTTAERQRHMARYSDHFATALLQANDNLPALRQLATLEAPNEGAKASLNRRLRRIEAGSLRQTELAHARA
jgi:hypothetical protein